MVLAVGGCAMARCAASLSRHHTESEKVEADKKEDTAAHIAGRLGDGTLSWSTYAIRFECVFMCRIKCAWPQA